MNHSQFIQKLSQCLGRPLPSEPPSKPKWQLPAYNLANQDERVATFLEKWQNLGGQGKRANSPQAAAAILQTWFGNPKPPWLTSTQSILAWTLPEFAEETFAELGWPLTRYALIEGGTSVRARAAAISELGVTSADWGIARSGSLVLKSSSGRGRAVSLLPPRHLVFLPAAAVLDDLIALMEQLLNSGIPPAALELITGPSRTSDIEMDLSIGVHGPIEVYVLITP